MFPPIRLREALSLGGLSVRELAIRTWLKILENEIMTRAAAVSFYAMMALVPFLGLVLTITIELLPDLRGPSGTTIGFANMTVGELRQIDGAHLPSRGLPRDREPDHADSEAAPGGLHLGRAWR